MSKNIVIQEGSIGKQVTADKLKTNLVGGGTCLWVPEDETTLGTKSITANGTYKASDDGNYGYSQVTVNVAGGSGSTPGGPGSSVIGRDSDGDEAVAAVDDDGDLHTTKIPSSIAVVNPPTNPYGTYTDGQSIGTNGMEVKAYTASGTEWGIVPNDQVTLNPATAAYNASTDTHGEADAEFDGDYDWLSYFDIPLHLYGGFSTKDIGTDDTGTNYEVTMEHTLNSGGYIVGTYYGNNPVYIAMSLNGPIMWTRTTKWIIHHSDGSDTERTSTDTGTISNTVTTLVKGTKVYCGSIQIGTSKDTILTPAMQRTSGNFQQIATVAFDGTLTPKPAGSLQTITVSWPRPGDGQVLETTFEIRVAPSPSGDDDN